MKLPVRLCGFLWTLTFVAGGPDVAGGGAVADEAVPALAAVSPVHAGSADALLVHDATVLVHPRCALLPRQPRDVHLLPVDHQILQKVDSSPLY